MRSGFHAGAGEGRDGRPLAAVRGSGDVRAVADFPPVRKRRLRFRIFDTAREDHASPRLLEIEVWRAADGMPAAEPAGSPIAGEERSERELPERAPGR